MNKPSSAPEGANRSTPIIGIAGWKKSGKTTLTVRLVEEFTRRGLVIATVKHAHDGFQIDDGATDSARHRTAGAAQVAVVSAKRAAVITELHNQPEPNFDEVIGWLAPCDLILVEGYKTAAIAKVEARRLQSRTQTPLADDDPLVIAIAADHAVEAAPCPVFHLDDITAIADLIDAKLGPLVPRSRAASHQNIEPTSPSTAPEMGAPRIKP